MKQIVPLSCLLLVLLLTSFQETKSPTFSASVNGKNFELSNGQLFRGIVAKKSGTLDGRIPTRTVITATFNGPSYDMAEGRFFNENIQLNINYQPDKTGEAEMFDATMQYESGNYYSIVGQSKLTVTGFEWDSDKKYFWLSATFNCTLRSSGAPADGKQDISLSGQMKNIRITVPGWAMVKN